MLAGANAGRITLGVIVRSWLCASDWISQGPLSRRSHRCGGYAHERAHRGIVLALPYTRPASVPVAPPPSPVRARAAGGRSASAAAAGQRAPMTRTKTAAMIIASVITFSRGFQSSSAASSSGGGPSPSRRVLASTMSLSC